MIYLAAFLVVFVRIGLAVSQQRHIEERRFWLIPPISMITTAFDCATYGLGAAAFMAHDWIQVGFMGLGAGCGSLFALWAEHKLFRNQY